MLGVWVMTKSFDAPSGPLPVAWSYGYNHSANGFQENGWGLAWVSMDVQQLVFIRSGIDPNVQYVGKDASAKPTPLLLETYADQLGDGEFSTLGEVLDKLGEWEPRFWLERDPHKP